MSKKIVLVAFLAAATLPSVTHAQGTVRGAEEGAREGYRQGGPVGEILGGAAGAVTGTIGGILGVEERPRFREYVIREGRPSHQYGGISVWAHYCPIEISPITKYPPSLKRRNTATLL
jgi:hypothetical protein